MKTLSREAIQRMTGTSNGGTRYAGGSGGTGGGGGGSAAYADEAGHAASADEATHATSADTATTATTAGNLDANSTDWLKIARKDIEQNIAEVWTFAKGIVSTLRSYFNGGATVSKASGDTGNALVVIGGTQTDTFDATGNAYVGGTLNVTGKLNGHEADFTDVTMDNLGTSTDRVTKAWVTEIDAKSIGTETLNVSKEAYFTKLVVGEMLSNKGAIILSSANCVSEIVTTSTGYYTVYFSQVDGSGNSVNNSWRVGDLALCLTFKAEGAGTFANVRNRYYWRKVLDVGTQTVSNVSYYYIRLSRSSGEYEGSTVPAAGDNIIQLGYTGSDAAYRQSAIILSSYPTMDSGVTPPSLAFYKGIGSDENNLFNLTTHRYTFMDAFDNDFYGNFRIFVDNSWQNITTFFATAAGVSLEVTNLRSADAQLKVASDEIRMGVENGFREYVANPLAIDATVSICRTSSTSATDAGAVVIDDADFGKVRQIYNYSQGDFQLLNGFDEDNRADLSNATAVTIFAIIKPMGYGQIHFGIWSSNYGKSDLLQVNSSASGVVSSVTSSEANAECGKEYIGNGWWKVWSVFAPGLLFSELKSACGPNSVNASTWQVYYFGIMKGNGCPSVDEIRQGAGIKRAGIDIKNGVINLIANKVTFQNSDGTVSGKVSIDPGKGTLITQDAVLRGNLFLPYTRITQDNWSDYGTYSPSVGTTFNLLGEISGKTAAGLNIQIEYIQTVSSTTNLGHVRLPDLTDKDPDSWVGCEVNILNATTTEPLYVRGTLNGGNFGLAKWSNNGWNVSDHNVGINPGCEGKFKLIKTGSGTYKWICCYINLNQ